LKVVSLLSDDYIQGDKDQKHSGKFTSEDNPSALKKKRKDELLKSKGNLLHINLRNFQKRNFNKS
jgi:hypothetical protein